MSNDSGGGMTVDEIKASFAVDVNSRESLRAQLCRRLGEFIQGHAAGVRMPSERELAAALDISRVTVRNALKGFIERGDIAGRGRNGVAIAAKPQQSVPLDIHPMALGGMFAPTPAAELNVSLYENIPFQRLFWEEALRRFNQRAGVRARLNWLPKTVNEANYGSYLETSPCDVFQFSLDPRVKKLAAPLPPDIAADLRGDKYRTELFTDEAKSCLTHYVPLNLNVTLTFWNADLAAAIGLEDVRERIRVCGLEGLIAEAAEKLPPGSVAYGHVWDRLAHLGQPEDLSRADAAFFKERLGRLAAAKDFNRAYIYEQRGTFGPVERFRAGTVLFLDGAPSNAFVFGRETSFKMSHEPCPPAAGSVVPSTGMGLAINAGAKSPGAAAEFLCFMLSEELQELQARAKLTLPILRGAAGAMFDAENPCPPETIEKLLRRYRIHPAYSEHPACLFPKFLIYDVRRELYDFCSGASSIGTAAAALADGLKKRLSN